MLASANPAVNTTATIKNPLANIARGFYYSRMPTIFTIKNKEVTFEEWMEYAQSSFGHSLYNKFIFVEPEKY